MKLTNFKILYLILAVITFAYIFICEFFVTFSISVVMYFIAACFLFLALYFISIHPVDSKEDEPNPIYIFVKVAASLFFGITCALLLFNLLYIKHGIKDDEKFDYVIVFGAGITGKNEIINSRIENAIDFARKYRDCRFVLTGAKGSDEPIEEAYYMKDYMVKRGVEDFRIITEPFSINTNQNIVNSLELIKIDINKRNARDHIIRRPFFNKKGVYDLDFLNIGFMSSDFHMTRICMMAKKEGIKRPLAIPCTTNLLYVPYMYIRENLSLFKAMILNQL